MENCLARVTNHAEDVAKRTSEVRDAFRASVSVAESVYDSTMRTAHIAFEAACDAAIEASNDLDGAADLDRGIRCDVVDVKEKALSDYGLAKSKASDTHFSAMADARAKGFAGIYAIAEFNARHFDAMLSRVPIGISSDD